MAEKYNGYYNYNVWNVMLYVDNEYDIYQKKVKLFKDYKAKKITSAAFERGVIQIGRAAHMKSDVKKEKLTATEIKELRKELKEQYRELDFD